MKGAKTTTIAMVLFGCLNLAIAIALPAETFWAVMIGYLLGTLAIVLQYFTTVLIKRGHSAHFFIYLYATMVVRFIVVLAIFIVVLITTKIDELGFTVSFIISYIFHSVVDTILINQKMSKHPEKSSV